METFPIDIPEPVYKCSHTWTTVALNAIGTHIARMSFLGMKGKAGHDGIACICMISQDNEIVIASLFFSVSLSNCIYIIFICNTLIFFFNIRNFTG